MPKVSVIIPVYGVEKYIERCARSLFEQTLDDIEYLFIDDCTPDNSIEVLLNVLEDYPHRKPQVTIHRMDRNSGQAAVRKWGMINSTGDYVTHCDSDDWVELDMYETMYKLAINNNSDMVSCNYNEEYGASYKQMNKEFASGDTNIVLLKRILSGIGKLNSLWSLLVSRELCQRISFPVSNQSEDFAMITQFFIYSKQRSATDKYFYHYLINQQSISHDPNREKCIARLNDAIDNRLLAYRVIEKNGLSDILKNEITASKALTKCFILTLEKDSSFKTLWNSIFPEINCRMFFCPSVPLKLKFYHLLVQLNLPSILRRL